MTDKTKIPTRSRIIVYARDLDRCVRCRVKPKARQWHHRRGRAVDDEHQHASCNGITVCPTCHEWIHKHPFESRQMGWIVARHLIPCQQPMMLDGVWVLLAHNIPETSPFLGGSA